MGQLQSGAGAHGSDAAGCTCLRFDNLTLGYDAHPAVHGLSGSWSHGALMAIVGPNGSGKSTLLKGIAGLLPPMGGSVTHVDGCRMAYLPQASSLDLSFPATVFDLVKLGLWQQRGLLGRIRRQDRDAIAHAMSTVGLDGFAKRPIDTLSGGQLQRALFARVILQDADLILLDEPFNAIDDRTVGDLMAVIHGWHAEGRSVVAVMHDLDLVRAHFPQALLLSREPVASGATADVLKPENLKKARAFRPAWDDDAPWCSDDNHVHDAPSVPVKAA
ncbi:MAG: metal ABC transporter ATP-binding protein [Devosiaceae bacterium]|nr:metal ABC transporter ATP-binding protein [Devosiaceae bacterium MH13]